MATARNDFPEVPDYLRRFVIAPFEADWLIGEIPVHIETNHPEILHAFSPFLRDEQPASGSPFSLKAVVDSAVSENSGHSPVELDDGRIVLGSFHNILFALDRENRELLLFMQQFVASEFSELVFRLLSRNQPPRVVQMPYPVAS